MEEAEAAAGIVGWCDPDGGLGMTGPVDPWLPLPPAAMEEVPAPGFPPPTPTLTPLLAGESVTFMVTYPWVTFTTDDGMSHDATYR